MNGLRSLQRSVTRYKSYKLCGSSKMFHKLWQQYHYKNNMETSESDVNYQKQSKHNKGILSKFIKRLFSKIIQFINIKRR